MEVEENIKHPPKTYVTESIIVFVFTLCCCGGCIGCIPAIVSITYASKVEKLYNLGDYVGAERASMMAKNWMIGAVIFGIFMTMLSIILQIAIESSNPYYY
tara:strand:+ start:406 stop:708 length:303 start_codon:yes stop_codon:yes gene_type:complete